METHHRLKLLLFITFPFLFLFLLYFLFFYHHKSKHEQNKRSLKTREFELPEHRLETLTVFSGGEGLTVHDILDAPGEVVGNSSYGTLYRAGFAKSGSVMLLRFVRPGCVVLKDVENVVRDLGSVRDKNLVELRALYVGPRGERLFVYPFYEGGNLARFLKDGKAESHRWEIIYKLSIGIARGLDHLHNNLQKTMIHGNLKSKNVLIDLKHQPRLSDFGFHLMLNLTSAQEMLESSAAQCYKAPELIKMKDASKESDIYSLGVIFLEILTRKESTKLHLPPSLKTNFFIENTISETFITKDKNSTIEERLVRFFHLAMACCSPSPVLRPDIKQIIRKLEEL